MLSLFALPTPVNRRTQGPLMLLMMGRLNCWSAVHWKSHAIWGYESWSFQAQSPKTNWRLTSADNRNCDAIKCLIDTFKPNHVRPSKLPVEENFKRQSQVRNRQKRTRVLHQIKITLSPDITSVSARVTYVFTQTFSYDQSLWGLTGQALPSLNQAKFACPINCFVH